MLEQIRKDTLEYVKNLAIGQIQNVLESQKSLAINDIEAFGKETQTQIQDVIDNTTAQMQSIAEQFLSLQTAIEGQFTEALKRINEIPVVEKIVETIHEVRVEPTVTNEIREIALHESPQQIADKLNTLTEAVDRSVIKGLDVFLKNLQRSIKESKKERGGGVGGDSILTQDLSTATNGITKTFTVPVHRKALMVMCSDFPTLLLNGNGFTVNAARTQITLTTDNAPSSGSQLGFLSCSIIP